MRRLYCRSPLGYKIRTAGLTRWRREPPASGCHELSFSLRAAVALSPD